VGSISRLESFLSKRLTKNSWRKCNGARALKSKQSLLQFHNWPSTHTLTQSFLFVFETQCARFSMTGGWNL
jgi:hypothetical protein